jgi:hypothetical protein
MPTIALEVIHTTIVSGQRKYPIYVGFAVAEELAKVAEAPAFARTDTQRTIADEALKKPSDKWQRPLNVDSVHRIIQTFSNDGNFMPNPVLLADSGKGGVAITALPAPAGGSSGVSRIELTYDTPLGSKPLWIIDGQHRIAGMAQSHQSLNPIPVVLLLNGQSKDYSASDLARQFAQVTTTSTPLNELHQEWLAFAFDLSPYAATDVDAVLRKRAMTVTANLAFRQFTAANLPNPWVDSIIFNIDGPVTPCFGKAFDCSEFLGLVLEDLLKANSNITDEVITEQIMLATIAVRSTLKSTATSEHHVFTGSSGCQRVLVEGFLVAVLREIGRRGTNQRTLSEWIDLFRTLKLDQTDWDFRSLAQQGKRWTDPSKALASQVFDSAFQLGRLPLSGGSTIRDLLTGSESSFTVELLNKKPGGKTPATVLKSEQVNNSQNKTLYTVPKAKLFSIVGNGVNCVNMNVKEFHPNADPTKFKNGIGKIDLSSAKLQQQIEVEVEHYGGLTTKHTITIKP